MQQPAVGMNKRFSCDRICKALSRKNLLSSRIQGGIIMEDESYPEKRRFKRLKFKEDGFIQLDKKTLNVTLLDISAKGALLKFVNRVSFRKKDKFKLSFNPDNSSVLLNFVCEIVHCCNKLAGVKFVPITA
jgi:c-di-GMP-binding flagellar brake protein YcgR